MSGGYLVWLKTPPRGPVPVMHNFSRQTESCKSWVFEEALQGGGSNNPLFCFLTGLLCSLCMKLPSKADEVLPFGLFI